MNLDIAATGPAPPSPATPRPPADGADAVAADAPDADTAVTVDMIPSTPPPEVMDAIAFASEAADRLAANGQALHFRVDPPTGKVAIEVHDLQGNVQGTVSPSKVLDVADGGTIE